MNRRQASDASSAGRHEPRLGNVDQVGLSDSFAPAPRSRPKPARRPWLFWLLWLLIIGMCLATAWCYQDQLRALIPSTTLNQILSRADQALAAGQLDGHDGQSARELYEAARALSPDNDRAMLGLRQVAGAELDVCRQALAQHQLDHAEQALAVARQLDGGGVLIDQLQRDINARRAGGDQIGQWIQQADAALVAGHLDGDGGAATGYQRVLALNPDNPVALHGLEMVAAALSTQARQAMTAHDLAAAAATIERLQVLNPDYAEIPVLRGELAGQQQALSGQLQQDLDQAAAALREGRISGEQPDTALASYQAVLALDPENAQAKAGLHQVAQALLVQASAALDAHDQAQASHLLAQAAQLAPDSEDLSSLQARLTSPSAASTASVASTVSPSHLDSQPKPGSSTVTASGLSANPLTEAQQQQIQQWLTQAQRAAAAGQLMLPPGGSAYDLYRQVQSLQPDNPIAQQGLQALPRIAQQQLTVALGSGQLVTAEAVLASLSQLSPGDASLGVMREQLANAWIDQGLQQLDAGDRAGTAQALHHAALLSPANLRLPGLRRRLNASH